MDAKLVVVGGKANKAEVKLKLPTVVGRGRDADLTVAHGTVSRHHCLIYEVDGALVVRDNGSLNGTLIGGQRINESLLKPGDTLTVGPLTFRADYEHNGAFPSLGDQPTIPNFQDTVGEEDASAGAAVTADPPAASEQEPGQFDFLGGASATAPTVEEEEEAGIPNFEQPAAAEDDAEVAPAATSGEQTLDFLAGGSDVAPVSDDDAPGFDFLNQAATPEAEASDQAPSFDSLAESTTADQEEAPADAPAFDALNELQSSGGEAPAETDFQSPDAAVEAVEPSEPEAVADALPDEAAAEAPGGGFDFLNAADGDAGEEPAVLTDESPQSEAVEPEAAAVDESPTTEDKTVSEGSGFDFLNREQPAAQEAAPELSFEAAAAETAGADAEPTAAELAAEQAPDETPVEKAEGGFDFLNAADEQATDEPAAAMADDTPQSELAAESSAVEEPVTTADVEDETVSEGSGVGFLNQAEPATEEAAPDLNLEAVAAEATGAESEPIAMESAAEPAPKETPAVQAEGGFDFLNAAAEAATEEPAATEAPDSSRLHADPTDASPNLDAETLNADEGNAVDDAPLPEADAALPDESPEAAASEDEEESGLPQFDTVAETPAGVDSDAAQDSEADDDSPGFGFLGNMASDAEVESDEPEAASPELTLHDPEESEEELVGLGDSPELADESSLKFDDDNSPPTASNGGFDFLAAEEQSATVREDAESFPAVDSPNEIARVEPELTDFSPGSESQAPTEQGASHLEPTSAEEPEFVAPVEAADDELPVAESDDDSGEFAIPLEPLSGEDGDAGAFSFLNETPVEAAAEQEEVSSGDDAEGYAISQEPVASAPPQSFSIAEETETPEDEDLAEEEAAAVDEERAVEPSVDSQPQDAKAKKKGWWPFGKSKGAATADATDKTVDKPVAEPTSDLQVAGSQPNFHPAPVADDDEAALGFLSDDAPGGDSPAPPSASNGNGKQSAGDSAEGFQIQTDKDGKRPSSGGDDELNNFFESIGLD